MISFNRSLLWLTHTYRHWTEINYDVYEDKKSIFLRSFFKPVRSTAVPLNSFLKVGLSRFSQLGFCMFIKSCEGSNAGSLCGRTFRFHGQTSWQISQPKIHCFHFPWNSFGISSPRYSMVRYEIHLRASNSKADKAPVGQASIHCMQLPQQFATVSASGVSAKSSMIWPIKKNEPPFRLMSMVFFPINPSPARHAVARSSTGAESTKIRADRKSVV